MFSVAVSMKFFGCLILKIGEDYLFLYIFHCFFPMVSPLTDVGVRYPKKGGPNFQNQETLSPKNRLLESQKRVTTYFFPVLVFKGLPV